MLKNKYKIKILPSIATKTYYLNKKISSISYITNIKNQNHYIIKGKLSDLWDKIVLTHDYNSIFNFAAKMNFEYELNNFLLELEQRELIKTNIPKIYNKKKYINFEINENHLIFPDYKKEKSKFILFNNFLDFIYLEMNYKCNLNCKHCCNPKNMDEYFITFEKAKEIIDEAYKLGVGEIVLTGGECTINKDFLKIAEYIRKKHIGLYILTNGQKLYDDNILFDKIVSLYPSCIKISIYSMNPEIHDYITGVKGSLNKSISVIKKLKEKNVNVMISSFQMSYNIDSFEDIEKFAMDIDVSISPPDCKFNYNKQNNNIDAKLKEADIINLYKKHINDNYIKARQNTKKQNDLICTAGTDRFSITPQLDITPCVYFNYALGNYNSTTLEYVIKRVIPDFQKKLVYSNLLNCNNEEYCKFCRYCPIFAIFDSTFLNKSKILCEDAKAFLKAYLQYVKSV